MRCFVAKFGDRICAVEVEERPRPTNAIPLFVGIPFVADPRTLRPLPSEHEGLPWMEIHGISEDDVLVRAARYLTDKVGPQDGVFRLVEPTDPGSAA